MNAAPPFVGREKEIRQLSRMHAQRKQVLILGPQGVGKSALMTHLRHALCFVLSERSTTLGDICDALEAELGFSAECVGGRHQRHRPSRPCIELTCCSPCFLLSCCCQSVRLPAPASGYCCSWAALLSWPGIETEMNQNFNYRNSKPALT